MKIALLKFVAKPISKLGAVGMSKPEDTKDEPSGPRQIAFWDSWWALGLMVAAIFFARFYIVEPFKIPTGSMEPELIGHDDYGDRIATNKLAYVSKLDVLKALGGALAIIIGGLAWSILYNRESSRPRIMRSIIIAGGTVVLLVGGMGFAWVKGAIAGEPSRFNVVVFEYNKVWGDDGEGKQNYIKRLAGLPGDTITISGGDLFKYDRETGKDEILRKWKEGGKDLQDSLWYPISKAWSVAFKELTDAERARIAFPWDGAGAKGAMVQPRALELDGSTAVHLEYKYLASNIYLKRGRWPFQHTGCPEANKPGIKGEDGLVFRDDTNTSEQFSAYVTNTWDGVQCPYCKQILFPLVAHPQTPPAIIPIKQGGPKTNFFYGGDHVVGDLRLDMDIDVIIAGTIEMEVGSDLHRAVWKIPSDANPSEKDGAHPVMKAMTQLSPGKHQLSLAYVDATVIAKLDGSEIECREIADVRPPDKYNFKSIARVSFDGMKGIVTKLDLYRDLFYTTSGFSPRPRAVESMRGYSAQDGNFQAAVPSANTSPDHQNYYFMLGDNSPGSFDSRGWGFVPRSELVGRGSFIWWPPSRWGLIK